MLITTALDFEKKQRKVLKHAWKRPPFMVAKRNARERIRVHAVNQAFVALKFHLPAIRSTAKRVSKLKILRAAINYIATLTDLLRENADLPKLNSSNYSCNDTINVSSRPKQSNQVPGKEIIITKDGLQRIKPQNIHDAAQCYNKQYWLAGHSVSN